MSIPTRNYPAGYKVPLHNVLLISCMDLRLLDNIVHFMEHENLTNRYDQYIMAGASIGALVGSAADNDELGRIAEYKCWETALLHHVRLSIQLHSIKDIYILEHQHCGAYKAFMKDGGGDYEVHGHEKEYEDHKKYALQLSDKLRDFLTTDATEPGAAINVHGFLMDIRGNVELLCTTAPFVEKDRPSA